MTSKESNLRSLRYNFRGESFPTTKLETHQKKLALSSLSSAYVDNRGSNISQGSNGENLILRNSKSQSRLLIQCEIKLSNETSNIEVCDCERIGFSSRCKSHLFLQDVRYRIFHMFSFFFKLFRKPMSERSRCQIRPLACKESLPSQQFHKYIDGNITAHINPIYSTTIHPNTTINENEKNKPYNFPRYFIRQTNLRISEIGRKEQEETQLVSRRTNRSQSLINRNLWNASIILIGVLFCQILCTPTYSDSLDIHRTHTRIERFGRIPLKREIFSFSSSNRYGSASKKPALQDEKFGKWRHREQINFLNRYASWRTSKRIKRFAIPIISAESPPDSKNCSSQLRSFTSGTTKRNFLLDSLIRKTTSSREEPSRYSGTGILDLNDSLSLKNKRSWREYAEDIDQTSTEFSSQLDLLLPNECATISANKNAGDFTENPLKTSPSFSTGKTCVPLTFETYNALYSKSSNRSATMSYSETDSYFESSIYPALEELCFEGSENLYLNLKLNASIRTDANASRLAKFASIRAFHFLYPIWITIPIIIVAVIASLLTALGNLVVLSSFIIERNLRQANNYFIISLAVSDLLIGVFSMPFYTIYLLLDEDWPLGSVICKLWLALDYTVCLASQYTVCHTFLLYSSFLTRNFVGD